MKSGTRKPETWGVITQTRPEPDPKPDIQNPKTRDIFRVSKIQKFWPKSGHFCLKNLKTPSKNFPKKKKVFYQINLFFFKLFFLNYKFFEVSKIFMHKNAIKRVGGVKISEISPHPKNPTNITRTQTKPNIWHPNPTRIRLLTPEPITILKAKQNCGWIDYYATF